MIVSYLRPQLKGSFIVTASGSVISALRCSSWSVESGRRSWTIRQRLPQRPGFWSRSHSASGSCVTGSCMDAGHAVGLPLRPGQDQ